MLLGDQVFDLQWIIKQYVKTQLWPWCDIERGFKLGGNVSKVLKGMLYSSAANE